MFRSQPFPIDCIYSKHADDIFGKPRLPAAIADATTQGWASIAGMPGTAITTAFIPVRDPRAAAGWYGNLLGLTVAHADNFSAVLSAAGTASVTLMGPDSGIKAEPGLPWATCNFLVDDLEGTRARLAADGVPVGSIDGAPDVCLFFTAQDPDGNTLLLTDR